MTPDNKFTPPSNKNISIGGDVVDSVVIVGDKNTVNQTIIQKFFNIFKSDSESMEHRNRRILLGHVENAWITGVLDASLHGAALLDLGIKENPEAVTKYPWAIKKESTNETLPTGTSMLEIFDNIGMGRSLFILGAPGSGKTTMLLELARQLIQRAREDETQSIPMVFNLASWTEKLTLADWLAQELNNLYSVPRKTAPDWVKGNKLLLLLDGLDEVRQESRAKCVDAINAFRKEHGMTSLAVCSRSQDYADLNAKLSFEGAIEVQPLKQKQITEFFNRFGKEMAGIKQVLKKDSTLREMAKTPLFLSIMLMAYRDKQDVEILVSGDEKIRRKHLFETYIESMLGRRTRKCDYKNQDILHYLSWLAKKMAEHNSTPYLIEDLQPEWLDEEKQFRYLFRLIIVLLFGTLFGLLGNLILGLLFGLFFGISVGLLIWLVIGQDKFFPVDSLSWSWSKATSGFRLGLIYGLIVGVMFGLLGDLFLGLVGGLINMLSVVLVYGLRVEQADQLAYPEQRLFLNSKNFLFTFIVFALFGGVLGGLGVGKFGVPLGGLFSGLFGGLIYGGKFFIQYYSLRFVLARNNLLPWRLVPFLDHCVDLIFLRRVGGGYIFIHRLLMEHFAEMYEEG